MTIGIFKYQGGISSKDMRKMIIGHKPLISVCQFDPLSGSMAILISFFTSVKGHFHKTFKIIPLFFLTAPWNG